jgi:hypothetical protein
MSRRIARFTALLFGVGAFLLFARVEPAEAAGNVRGWAWSGNTGWIVTNCLDAPDGCAGPGGDYGLNIDDDADLSGWAWSVQAGWICFGAACIGATGVPASVPTSPAEAANHFCPGDVPCAMYNIADQQLHGWAYVPSQTDGIFRGWISLNCEDVGTNTADPHSCPTSDYGVDYDEDAAATNGELYGYAWNGNGDSTGNGWIQFGCGTPHASCGAPGPWGVTSTYVSTGWEELLPIEGIYSPSPPPAAGAHLTDVTLTFTDFSAPAGSTLRCVFVMSDGTRRAASWPITVRQAHAPTFAVNYVIASSDAVADLSGNPVTWSFSSEPPDPPFGCEIQGSPPDQRAVPNRLAVHPSVWTFGGFGGADSLDSSRAKYCLDGNTDTNPSRAYFLNLDAEGNVVQCDTEGDLALTLLKAKGVPVEVRCYDNLDDDANLQRDCAGGTPATVPDRNCRGITYLCIPHPPASAPQPPRP